VNHPRGSHTQGFGISRGFHRLGPLFLSQIRHGSIWPWDFRSN
jgi:hypothetical protein